MSGHISLEGENWYGTQMKPDLLEPATAEWAGRAAMNAGWLFERQQQVLFADGQDRLAYIETPAMEFQQFFRRRFRLNEVFGTFGMTFNLGGVSLDVYVAATIAYGFDHTVWAAVGTCDGTYNTPGWKTLTMYALRTGWTQNQSNYGQFLLNVCNKTAEQTTSIQYFCLTGYPRT